MCLALLTLRNDASSFGEFEMERKSLDKTQTVEHKCKCALTEKGVVITLKLGQIKLKFRAKTMKLFDFFMC